ncbi:MAG: cytochrome c [Nitrospinota bacterium]|nr:cytochrome c [Nitrospinota bacterium]
MTRILALAVSALMAVAAPSAMAADGKALVESNKCGSCHKMVGPSAQTIAEVMKRKAPDLFYAGSKFNKDWLVKYIQSPTTLRAGGVVYLNSISLNGEADVVKDPPKCASKLSAGDAAAVADYLMTLKDASMKTGVFKPGKVKKARARVVMMKDEACNACHVFPGKGGGISCPTFEGIGERLNPDWMYSFIQDPKHWDPKVWMAKRDFDDATLQLMVNFLMTAD